MPTKTLRNAYIMLRVHKEDVWWRFDGSPNVDVSLECAALVGKELVLSARLRWNHRHEFHSSCASPEAQAAYHFLFQTASITVSGNSPSPQSSGISIVRSSRVLSLVLTTSFHSSDYHVHSATLPTTYPSIRPQTFLNPHLTSLRFGSIS